MTNEERVLEIQNGKNKSENLERLYVDNMGLWVSCLRPFRGLAEWDDLKQQAFLSVVEAVKRYNPERGSFANFAALIVKQDVPVYLLSCGNGLSCPSWLNKRKGEYLRLVDMGITDEEELARRLNISVESLRVLAVALGGVVSLNTELEEGSELGELIASGEDLEGAVVERIGAEQLSQKVREELQERLSGRRLEIVEALFIRGESIASLSARLGVSVQRVQQLKEDCLNRLRKSEELEELALDYEFITLLWWRSGFRNWKHTGTSCEEKYLMQREQIEQRERKLSLKLIEEEKRKEEQRQKAEKWKRVLEYVEKVKNRGA